MKKFTESVNQYNIFNNREYLEDLLTIIEDCGVKLISIEYQLQRIWKSQGLYKVGDTNNKSFKSCLDKEQWKKIKEEPEAYNSDSIYRTYVINFYFQEKIITSDEQRTGRGFSEASKISEILIGFNSIKKKLSNDTVLYSFEKPKIGRLYDTNFAIMIIEGIHT